MSARHDTIVRLAEYVAGLNSGSPLRVAIDGRTGSGKSTLTRELETELSDYGRPVIQTSIDGFHHPKVHRYARGRYSAEGYYRDARDLKAVVDLLLRPLGPEGNRRFCIASFDLEKDVPLPLTFQTAAPNTILLVDGTFLQRPELHPHWDLTIFVETHAAVARNRAVSRDASAMGDLELAQRLYTERYLPAFQLYQTECDPVAVADVLFDNNDLAHPSVKIVNGREKIVN